MIKLDFEMITTIKLYINGFENAVELAKKLTNLFNKAKSEW